MSQKLDFNNINLKNDLIINLFKITNIIHV